MFRTSSFAGPTEAHSRIVGERPVTSVVTQPQYVYTYVYAVVHEEATKAALTSMSFLPPLSAAFQTPLQHG